MKQGPGRDGVRGGTPSASLSGGMRYGDAGYRTPRRPGGAYAGRRAVKKAVAKDSNTQAMRVLFTPKHNTMNMGFGKSLRKLNKDRVSGAKAVYKLEEKKNAAPKVPAKSSRKPAKVAGQVVRRYKAPGKA